MRKIGNVSFGNHTKKGFRDIKAETKQSGDSGFYLTYRYNGKMYEATECFKYSVGRRNVKIREPIDCYSVEDDSE